MPGVCLGLRIKLGIGQEKEAPFIPKLSPTERLTT